MSAILRATVMALLKAGDYVVASRRAIFGVPTGSSQQRKPPGSASTPPSSPQPAGKFRAAMRPNTRLAFTSKRRPILPTENHDIAALAGSRTMRAWLAAVEHRLHAHPTSVLARADSRSTHTKYLDGQGRVPGGAVCGPEGKAPMEEVVRFCALAVRRSLPFNAWAIPGRLETLPACRRSRRARWKSGLAPGTPKAAERSSSGLPSHPQHELALRHIASGGAIVASRVKGGRAKLPCRRSLPAAVDHRQSAIPKTTITHLASTTHAASAPRRAPSYRGSPLRVAPSVWN